jgi:hypothetical protein
VAFLDKFNAWYNKVVSDDELSVAWMEPSQGARYRWRKERKVYFFALVALFFLGLLPWGRDSSASHAFHDRAVTAAGLVAVAAAAGWISNSTKTPVVLTRSKVVMGTGRSRTRYDLADYGAIRLESLEGYRTVVFLKGDCEDLRIFLAPKNEAEVLAFVAGLPAPPILQESNASAEPMAPGEH